MTSISTISEKLRQARIRSGLSIDDLSAATRINASALREIDEGRMPNLPRTYVRAFLRAYATHVGVDSDAILQMLEETLAEPGELMTLVNHSTPAPGTGTNITNSKAAASDHRPKTRALLFLVSFLILAFIGVMVWLRSAHRGDSVQEISFSDVVREHEAKQATLADSAVHTPSPGTGTALVGSRIDSLRLEAVASESVWVHIVIDGVVTKEYMFSPHVRMHWMAKKSFLVSLGHGNGISFTLNGKALGALGTSKKPIKNVMLEWKTLQPGTKE